MDNKYTYKHSEVLALISQSHKEKLINDDERSKIKEFFVVQEPDLSTAMEDYAKDKNLSKFVDTMKFMCGLVSMSSPLDSALQRKKHRQKTAGSFTNDLAKKESRDNFAEFNALDNIQSCDIGQSPKIDPRRFNKDDEYDDSDSD